MTFLAFIVGLTIGLGICVLQQYRIQRKIRQILTLLPRNATETTSLSILSRLRRELSLAARSQQQLETKLQVLQQILEQAPIGYLQIDEFNQLLWCNEYSRHLLKIDRWQPDRKRLLLELVRSYELDRLIEETRQEQNAKVKEWIFNITNVPREERQETLFSPRSVDYSLALRALSLPLPEGEVGIFLENCQPIVDAISSRDRVFSDLTHELRTPLTSIYLVAEALQTRVDPSQKTWVEQMLRELDRLIALIEDCLDIAQLQKQPETFLELTAFNLQDLIFSVWQTLQPLAQKQELELIYSEIEPVEIIGDRDRLTQVFLNLLDNSIKHSPFKSVIRVEVAIEERNELLTEQKSWITIDVIDSGSGFRESDLERVFERLYRGDASRQRTEKTEFSQSPSPRRGSGLGLSIAQQIIAAHGGAIAAKNHPETRGAWLRIQLPNFH